MTTSRGSWKKIPLYLCLQSFSSGCNRLGLPPQVEWGKYTFSTSWPGVRLQILGTVLHGVRTPGDYSQVSDLTWLPPPSPPSHPAPNPLSQFLPKELSDSLISFLGLDLPLLRSLSMIDENVLKEYPPHFFPTSPGGNVFYLFILRPST